MNVFPVRNLRLLPILLLVGAVLFGYRTAVGWPHAPVLDPDLVQGSDLIVIAHVKQGSIVYVPRDSGSSWKHTAVLVLGAVLKGRVYSATIPVIFRYGMDPLVVGEHGRIQGVSKGISDPNAQIVMGWQGGMYGTIPGDLGKDHIWFLRYRPVSVRPPDAHEDQNVIGVSEPEELQPIELKPYFAAFLTPKPQDVMKQLAAGDSMLALRCRTYLNRPAFLQILGKPDVQKRANLLLPYFLFTDEEQKPPDQHEAATALWSKCAEAGPASLLPYFDNPKYQAMQFDILEVWANSRYSGCIPRLIDALDKETQYWQNQTPDQRDLMVDVRPDHHPTREQNDSMRRIEWILRVFGTTQDPRGEAEIAKVAPIWKQMFPENIRRQLGQEINDGLFKTRT